MKQTLKALIIEDEELARNLLKSYLKDHPSLELIGECENGFEGVQKINELKPDVVFLDIQMPKMDGLEATKIIRKDPKLTTLPIVALTARAMKSDEEKCLAAGMNAYISKPLDLELLFQIVEGLAQCK